MRRVVQVCLALTLVLSPSIARPADPPSPADYQRVEDRFREAISAWSYQQWWALWEMGNNLSRFQIPREEFAVRMRQSHQRSAGGRQIEGIQVYLSSSTYGTVHARLGVENSFESQRREISRSFTMKHEDGDWRVTLHEFLGLAR